MFRVDGPTAAPGGLFTDGDPAVPTSPTSVPTWWLNMVQEEAVAVVLAAGLTLSKGNNGQLLQAIQSLISSGGVTFASDAEAIAGALTGKALSPHSGLALVNARISAVVNGAPGALDTLKELADAIGDDANFAGTVTAALAARAMVARQIVGGGLVTGGGDLSADRTLTVTAASSNEIATGTEAGKVITPAALAGVGGANARGEWTTLPGGYVQQMGAMTINGSGTSSTVGTLTFPTPFASRCIAINGNADDGVSGSWRPCTVTFPGGPSTSGCQVLLDSTDPGHPFTAPRTVYWIAVGK